MTELQMTRRALLGAVGFFALAAVTGPATAADAKLKIGFVGVTSGPAAAWGTSNVRSMQTRAAWLNEMGGV
jgi:branched-chain amino acid transport system substrate-binding protein